jgi:hypothetical protein
MREITFRGRRLYNGKCEWIYGFLEISIREGSDPVYAIRVAQNVSYYVDPSTIGQCTNLKDANGQLIHEGDILRDKEDNYLVEWDKKTAMFTLSSTTSIINFGFGNVDSEWYEVVGNIHDDTEEASK